MSLRVWLPLNGNLKNQGLSNIQITNGGATINTGGKIGSCYAFDGSQYITLVSNDIQNIFQSPQSCFSMACWIYLNTDETDRVIIFGNYSANPFINWELAANCTQRLCAGGTSNYTNKTNGYVIPKEKWTHIAVTYDGNLTTFYVDGILQGSYSGANTITTKTASNTFWLGSDNRSGATRLKGRMNDFRLYDHCLSKKEVEEIAMGLVLHYKLDNGGLGNLNLLKESSFTHKLIQGHASDYSHPLVIYNGGVSNHTFEVSDNGMIQDTILLNSASNLGIGFERLASDIDLDTSSYYTLSCEAKCSQANSSLSIGLSYYKTDDSAVWRGGSNKKAFNAIDTWQKFTLTFKPDADTKVICYCFTVLGVSSGTDTWSIRACKMEKGSVATSWSPNPADLELDTSIIYDSSGYQNNGEIINNISITSDTPRYNAATHMSATNQKIKISNFPTSGFGNSYTFAWWEKISSVTPMHWGFADGIRVNGMYTGRLWNTGDSSNNPLYNPGTTTQVTAPTVNVWHHWVMTGNGSKCLVYQDGELWAEAKTYKSISGQTIYINGWDSGTSYCSDNASMSDFRIYCTALTAEQVKELYDTSATIDKDGNVYAREVQEI